MSPDDPAIEDLYTQAIDLYFKDMPSVPVVQTTFVMPFNGHYWSGWPHDEDIKTVPFTWWPEFQFTLYNLKSTGVAYDPPTLAPGGAPPGARHTGRDKGVR